MDIKSVMSAAGSLASKDIIEMHKDTEEIYSLTESGEEYAEKGLLNVEYWMYWLIKITLK